MNWNVDELKERGYNVGSILRVYMVNFITYDEAEVFPGPKLNVVIGPNGTGKSTMTHAICLACGGLPSSIGRSDDIREFVKRGKENEEACCEVTLLQQNSVVTVRRSINHENKSSKWSINGLNCTQSAVKNLMKSLNIDVDNLCSFMPQDKVGNFSQLAADGILKKTLECIKTTDDKTLFQEQMLLSDEQNEINVKERDRNNQQVLVAQLEQQINGMRAEVERIRQRDAMIELLKLHKVRLSLTDLEDKTAIKLRNQELVDEANNTYAIARENIQPMEKVLREITARHTINEKAIKTATANAAKNNELVNIQKERLLQLDINIATTVKEIESMHSNRHNLEVKLLKINENINIYENQFEAASAKLPSIKEHLEQYTNQSHEYSNQIHKLRESQALLESRLRDPSRAIQSLQQQLHALKDPKEIFKNKLKSNRVVHCNDIITAMDWLSQNRNKFRGECYGPAGAEIQITNMAIASMIEAFVPLKYLMAFVVDNSADEALFQDFKKKNRLVINIYTIKHKDQLPLPFSNDFINNKKSEWGLQGYLSSQLAMPDLVRVFFNHFAGLHNAIWAKGNNLSTRLPSNTLNELCNNPSNRFRMYVADIESNSGNPSFSNFDSDVVKDLTEFSASKSLHASANDLPSLRTMPVKPARVLDIGAHDIDATRLEIENEIRKNKEIVDNLNSEISTCVNDMKYLTRSLDELKNTMKDTKAALTVPNQIRLKIDQEKKRANELRKQLSTDQEALHQELQQRINEYIQDAFNTINDTYEKSGPCMDAVLDKAALTIALRSTSDKLYKARDDLEEGKRNLSVLEADIKAKQKRRDEANSMVKVAEDAIKELQEEMGMEEFGTLFARAARELAGKTKEELHRQVQIITGQLEATVENPELMRRYENSTKELQEAVQRLEMFNLEYAQAEEMIAARKNSWLHSVRAIARKLDVLFSTFMEELNYQGNIELYEANSLAAFEMRMFVSFREGHDLTQLSGQSHSGGERAVSTIMYLMALQDLTSSPFRVVDEINQGMDERNERLVIDRIVRSCCKSDKGSQSVVFSGKSSSSSSSSKNDKEYSKKMQYFLVTPKLLPGLRALDNEDVTVLLIWNGPGVAAKWQLGEVISSLKKRKAELLDNSHS